MYIQYIQKKTTTTEEKQILKTKLNRQIKNKMKIKSKLKKQNYKTVTENSSVRKKSLE